MSTGDRPPATQGLQQTGQASGVRVLIVEDSEPVARVFSMLLRQMGHEVQVARSGEEALEELPGYMPTVVFSDISMPAMNGYELAQRIRKHPDLASLFLVAMTGYGEEEDRQRALASGFDEHIVKPPDSARLAALFRSIAHRA